MFLGNYIFYNVQYILQYIQYVAFLSAAVCCYAAAADPNPGQDNSLYSAVLPSPGLELCAASYCSWCR